MAAKDDANPSTHFGRQVRKERLARGWTLQELAGRTSIDNTTLSKIEHGHRPPTEKTALAMDAAFPERQGWFLEYYDDSKHAIPSGFRSWAECESKARDLVVWCPSIFDGSLQTEAYARAVLSAHPGVTPSEIDARLKGRIKRQERLLRDGGPAITWLVAHVALFTATGSAEIMAAQCAHVLDVASRPNATVQVVPPVAHPLATSLAYVADTGAYTEHALGGHVYSEEESMSRLRGLVATVRGEARPVRESLAVIQEARHRWTGGNRRTAVTGAGRASK